MRYSNQINNNNNELNTILSEISALMTIDEKIGVHNQDSNAHESIQEDINTHVNNKSNPHNVKLTQLGLTATAAELNKMDGVTATTAELNYVDGVTGNIQTQLNGKQATINGAATTITDSNLTASRALVSNSSGKVAASAVTSTELGYLDGVTSAIQTQLNNKAPSSHNHAATEITSGTLSSDRLPTIPITKGGTGATTASNARTNLDIYSKSEVDSELSNYVPTTRTINSKALSSNITLSASDVGADTSGTASSAVSTHNSSSSAHSNLFDVKADLVDDKVIPTQISSNVVFYNSSFTSWPDDYKAAGKMIIFQNSRKTQMQLTSGAYPVGTEIEIVQGNSYPVTVSAGSGVTVYSKDGLLSTNGQWSVICLKCISTDTWLVAGDLA